MINRDGFRKALNAAINGPQKKDVEWTTFGHDFNVKKATITKTSDGLVIDGMDGRHISHRKRFRPDDQIRYKCTVTTDGDVKDLEINIESTHDILKEWFKTAGEIVGVVAAIIGAGKADAAGAAALSVETFEPVQSSLELLDGEWEGDVEFMIANIIAFAVAKEMPEVANKTSRIPGFTVQTLVVNPAVIAQFAAAREQLVQRH